MSQIRPDLAFLAEDMYRRGRHFCNIGQPTNSLVAIEFGFYGKEKLLLPASSSLGPLSFGRARDWFSRVPDHLRKLEESANRGFANLCPQQRSPHRDVYLCGHKASTSPDKHRSIKGAIGIASFTTPQDYSQQSLAECLEQFSDELITSCLVDAVGELPIQGAYALVLVRTPRTFTNATLTEGMLVELSRGILGQQSVSQEQRRDFKLKEGYKTNNFGDKEFYLAVMSHVPVHEDYTADLRGRVQQLGMDQVRMALEGTRTQRVNGPATPQLTYKP